MKMSQSLEECKILRWRMARFGIRGCVIPTDREMARRHDPKIDNATKVFFHGFIVRFGVFFQGHPTQKGLSVSADVPSLRRTSALNSLKLEFIDS
jgi:hypothetical protein